MGFSQIQGQQRALHDLLSAWRQERIPNAYLFAGPEGCGKRTVALTLARLLNCHDPQAGGEPCERCSPCTKILHETHPDVWLVEPEKQVFRITQIREIQRMTHFPPQEGRIRVVILDQIERMNREAANAFLKLLEEPPPQNLFILCTPNVGQILPTILSRCQRIPFAPLQRDRLAAWLIEAREMEPERAALYASLAEGSLGKALRLAQSLDEGERQAILTALPDLHEQPRGTTLALEIAERLQQKGEFMRLYLDLIRTWLRDLLLLREIGVPTEQLIHRDLLADLQRHAARLSMAGIYRAAQAIDQAEAALMRNAAPLLTLEQCLLTFGGCS